MSEISSEPQLRSYVRANALDFRDQPHDKKLAPLREPHVADLLHLAGDEIDAGELLTLARLAGVQRGRAQPPAYSALLVGLKEAQGRFAATSARQPAPAPRETPAAYAARVGNP